MIDLREVRSVTEFQRNIKDYVLRLKKRKTPLVLTVNGRAELVVQDAEGYQQILERLRARGRETRAAGQATIRRGDRGRAHESMPTLGCLVLIESKPVGH